MPGSGTSRSMDSQSPNIDDIVGSKQAANRQKDKESLPRLLSFREWLKMQQRVLEDPRRPGGPPH
jgi:hypothetical protein